jgi:capsular exopolysaccharide synthesis family protein
MEQKPQPPLSPFDSQPGSEMPFDFSTLRERALGLWYKTKRLLKDHGRLVLICIGVCSSLFLVRALILGPVYVSYAKLMAGGQITIPEKSVFQEERLGYFGTQKDILQSTHVQQRALERVAALHPELKPVKMTLAVKLSEDAAILTLEAIGSQAEYTQAYLAAVIDAYKEFKRQIRAQTAENTSLAIHDELIKLQREIDDAEKEKIDFQKKHNVTFMREQGANVGANIGKLKAQLTELTTAYNLLESADIDSLPPGMEQLAGADVFVQYLTLKNELQSSELLLGQYKKAMRPNHPRLLSMQEKVTRLKSTISSIRSQSREALLQSRESLKSQIDNLNNVIAEWEKRALEFTQELAQFEQLDARLQRAQSLYEKLISSVQSVDISQKLSNDLLSVLQDATPALRVPSYFIKRAAIGAIIGALLGGGILFVISIFDNRMSSMEELTSQIHQPVFGVIPQEKAEEGKRLKLLSRDDDRPVFAEAYRNLRSSLTHSTSSLNSGVNFNNQNNTQKKEAQVIAITSSIPSEGKTTVSANLAVAFQLKGERVLIVDADLRKGRLHEDFARESRPGLSEILSKKADISSTLQTIDPLLHFLPRGATQDHPSELFGSPIFFELIAQMRSKYDRIIIDTPPLLAAEDCLLINSSADLLLYVVRAHFTQSPQMRAALKMLEQRGRAPDGFVFNLLDLEHPNYYHHKYTDYYHRSSSASQSSSQTTGQ